ncbi:hypothetical protein CPAV1605_78 [seawater metagenome]|uniref:Uncharacterized protein n=1 Tax=seawater metagenome TaxID=1561972 RepID=A0A5E8CH51_9ZZZZ
MKYKIYYKQFGGNRDKRIRKEFEKMPEEIKESIIINSRFDYTYKDLNIVIPEEYPFKAPILTEISTNRLISLEKQYWWGPARSILDIIKNYDTILKFGNRDLSIPSQNEEFLKWVFFKTVHNIGAKSFKQTQEFFIANKCKILISFDNNEKGTELINLFISYTEPTRKNIINYLFDNNTNIKYYICNNKSNVYFYDINILNIFLIALKAGQLYPMDFTINDLLELSCQWVTDTESFEYLLIHILFGSTEKCGWQSEPIDAKVDVSTIKDTDSDRIRKLKLVYQILLNEVNN